jgi:O-antigen ligase
MRPAPVRPTRQLPSREKQVLGAILFHLLLLPWAFGGMHWWSQLLSFSAASVGFVLALRPRLEVGPTGETLRYDPWRKLLKWPLFWAGLVLLGYMAVQLLNPSLRFRQAGSFWWVEQIEYISWLPNGMQGAPFHRMNGARALLVWGSAFLTVSAIWLGLTRRKSGRILAATLVVNGFILAIASISAKLLGAQGVLGLVETTSSETAGTFIYRNHGAAYFNLMLALSLGLAFWHSHQATRRMKRSSPAPLFGLFAFFLALASGFTFSRGGSLVALLILVALGLRLAWAATQTRWRWAAGGAVAIVVLSIAAGTIWMVRTMDFSGLAQRLEKLDEQIAEIDSDHRTLAAKATIDMIQGAPLLGWGAGNFRYVFPVFQQNYPLIYDTGFYVHRGERREYKLPKILHWEHAHNDWLQWIAELGILGFLPLVFAFGYWITVGFREGAWSRAPGAWVLVGAVGLMLHGAVDFPLQNPAVLITLAAVFPLAVRWASLERR